MTQVLETHTGSVIPPTIRDLMVDGAGLPPLSRLRLLLHGRVDCGKTTFACSWPRTAIISTEDKTGFVRTFGEGSQVFRFKTMPGRTAAQQFDTLVEWLIAEKNKGTSPFDTLVFDTMQGVRQFRMEHVTQQYRQYGLIPTAPVYDVTDYRSEGAGWSKLNRDVVSLIDRLSYAGFGWIAICHLFTKIQRKKQGAEELWDDSALNEGILQELARMADFAGHLVRDRSVDRQHHRLVSTFTLKFSEKHPRIPSKCPLSTFPIDMDITGVNGFEMFAAAYDAAILTAYGPPAPETPDA